MFIFKVILYVKFYILYINIITTLAAAFSLLDQITIE
jgi:hypothetical protein